MAQAMAAMKKKKVGAYANPEADEAALAQATTAAKQSAEAMAQMTARTARARELESEEMNRQNSRLR